MSISPDAFLQTTYTTSQVKRRLVLLKFFLDSKLFGGTKNLTDIDPNDQVWIGSLDDGFLQSFDKKDISSQLKTLSDEIAKVPVLTIIFSIEIPENELSELGSWSRQQFGKQLLIEAKLDPRLIAGCALIWDGVYKDYSIKSRIEAQQNQILESFKTYLK